VELISASVVLSHLKKDSSGDEHLGERSASISALLLVLLIPVIAIPSSYFFFFAKTGPEISPITLVFAAAAIAIMPALWLRKRKIGRDTNCIPLSIDAAESATCFFMAIALFAGLSAEYVFDISWADYAATLVILAFVAKEAYSSMKESNTLRKVAAFKLITNRGT
jgi:divalent metal cation (Fe/Co/Zn/Cd) transporter